MAKISFDFDSTLSRKDVQTFAKELVNAGHEIWIVTSRASNEDALMRDPWQKDRIIKSNKKLFRVADNVGIHRSNIKFMNFQMKSEFIKDNGFLFHLDDDSDELMDIISSEDPCKPVNVDHFEWLETCREILKLASL
jgi:hypothetical protein